MCELRALTLLARHLTRAVSNWGCRFMVILDSVSAIGRRDREIWVEVDTGRLESYQLSLADVILSLRGKNLDVPGGTLGSGRQEFLVRTMGEAETLGQIERVIVTRPVSFNSPTRSSQSVQGRSHASVQGWLTAM